MRKLVTSESVTEGHPDKVADKISDSILDAILAEDNNARVACETICTTGLVFVAGEITTTAKIDFQDIIRKTIIEIGYDSGDFNGNTCGVMVAMDKQSQDIAIGVDRTSAEDVLETIGAGDQGMMYGFATDETAEYMPLPISLAHKLTRRLAEVRKNGTLPYLRPDGKAQVTVEYDGDKAVRVDTVVLSTQHSADTNQDDLKADILREVIQKVIPGEYLDENTVYHINPTGRFVVGGPQGDVGLTGRKIIIDTYGGVGRHGGGAFSGKDPTKVDRSACYMARYAAKNVVAAKLAKRCEIQVSYAIGVSHPVSIMVDTFGTGVLPDDELADIIVKEFDFRPAAIIEKLDLMRPIYKQTAAYGHFGRNDIDLPWEETDMVESLRSYLPN